MQTNETLDATAFARSAHRFLHKLIHRFWGLVGKPSVNQAVARLGGKNGPVIPGIRRRLLDQAQGRNRPCGMMPRRLVTALFPRFFAWRHIHEIFCMAASGSLFLSAVCVLAQQPACGHRPWFLGRAMAGAAGAGDVGGIRARVGFGLGDGDSALATRARAACG